jgi:uncharacterized flavoprotein (TIGR03862 family)
MIAIIGAGPAGLMAAETLAKHGHTVHVFDAMPSAARKFLMAGKGGMNITHAEPFEQFLSRYNERRANLEPHLRAFTPDNLRTWIHELGIATFVGTSGRVFPTEMKAAPLLRAWLHRLRDSGVQFHMRHRWCAWSAAGQLKFSTETGEVLLEADAVVLALGGASWPQLGSDGSWVNLLTQRAIDVAPLRASNCGFNIAWSDYFREHFAGSALKSISASFDTHSQRGEAMITDNGIEGGLIYALSAALRDQIEHSGEAVLYLDLLPDWSAEKVFQAVQHPRGSRSLSSHLHSRLGLKGVKANLLREVLGDEFQDLNKLATTIKALPLKLVSTRPIAEAISSAGGIKFDALDENLMLKKLPGIFCAGEMLDWEAPTGGYLLSACFASGHAAGLGVNEWLRTTNAAPQ